MSRPPSYRTKEESSVVMRLIPALLLAVAAIIAWRLLRPPSSAPPRVAATAVSEHGAPATADVAALQSAPLENLDMARELDSPSGTTREDLRVLDRVLRAWQSNFLHDGNPVGDNAEITAALTGRNALRLAFISSDHPAINAQRELGDRWGTPFFFHQLSSTRMEIRSAGPDRKMYTDDDVVLEP